MRASKWLMSQLATDPDAKLSRNAIMLVTERRKWKQAGVALRMAFWSDCTCSMIICPELYSPCSPHEIWEMEVLLGCGEFESIIAQLETVIYIWPFDMRFLNWFLCLFWVGHRSGMSYNHLSTATTPWCWPQTSCSTISTSWLDVSICVYVCLTGDSCF